MGEFDGKVAWITGGGSGIGRALALELARRGADVAVSGRREDRLRGVCEEVEAQGRRALAVACDVQDDGSVRDAVARVVEGLGRLDVVVANAGLGVMGPVDQLDEDAWHRQIDVNVMGVVRTVRHAMPELRETGGRMALIGSVSGMLCAPGSGAYSASKFAVRAIGLTLNMELHGSGVSCTTLHPGFVESEISQVDNRGRFDPSRKDKRPQALMWKADKAARVMVDAIEKRRRELVFTGHGKIGAFLGRHCPGLVHLVFTRFASGASREMTKNKTAE